MYPHASAVAMTDGAGVVKKKSKNHLGAQMTKNQQGHVEKVKPDLRYTSMSLTRTWHKRKHTLRKRILIIAFNYNVGSALIAN